MKLVYCEPIQYVVVLSWWRHQMETFSALLAFCAGNSPVPGEFPSQRPVTRSFDFFFHLCLNKRLSKQSWGWWFETPSCSLWRHCNVATNKIPVARDGLTVIFKFMTHPGFLMCRVYTLKKNCCLCRCCVIVLSSKASGHNKPEN